MVMLGGVSSSHVCRALQVARGIHFGKMLACWITLMMPIRSDCQGQQHDRDFLILCSLDHDGGSIQQPSVWLLFMRCHKKSEDDSFGPGRLRLAARRCSVLARPGVGTT